MRRFLYAVAGGLRLVVVLSLLLPTTVLAQREEEFLGGVICWGTLLLVLVVNIALLVWVIKDAQARGASAGAWIVIVLLFGILGLLAYLVARPKGKLVPCPECGKQKPITDAICPHCGKRVV